MSRIVTFNPEAREKLTEGVNILGDAVGVTLGPKGRNVVIDTYGVPAVTKDGVTVARSIILEDPVLNLGAQIINQSAAKTARNAGDGTTSATVIAQELVNGATELVKAGTSPIDIKRQYESLLELIVTRILENSTAVEQDKIRDIATISANNDRYIGDLIADAFAKVGKEGVLTVEDSRTNDTYIRVVDGASIDRGYASPYFITDSSKMEAVFEEALIFVTDKKIRTAQEIIPILEQCLKAARPLVIIADEVEAQALALLIVNKVRNNLPVVAVRAPAYGERRGEILKDLAILTGAELISDAKGLRLEDTKLAHLGTAKKVIVTQDETVFVEAGGNQEAIAARAEEVKAKLAHAEHEYEIEKITERLARLIAKIAVLYVGAATETEMKEKKDRVDDAIRATRAAIAQGYVIGGGMALYNASKDLRTEGEDSIMKTFIRGVQAPARKIITNAGIDADHMLDQLDALKDLTKGFNASNGKVEDLEKSGVIDPTLVVLEAVTNAVSAANMIILSEVTIHDTKEKYQPMDPAEYVG